jgi:hypothetical protein
MGLDISDNRNCICVRVGGYSYVHQLRRLWITWTLAYVTSLETNEPVAKKPRTEEKSNPTDEKTEEITDAKKNMCNWLEPLSNFVPVPLFDFMPDLLSDFMPVNYKKGPKSLPDSFSFLGIDGLFWWVAHSDAFGTFSHGQCIDIVKLMDKIKPFINANETENIEHMEDMRKVFECAITNGGYVKLH